MGPLLAAQLRELTAEIRPRYQRWAARRPWRTTAAAPKAEVIKGDTYTSVSVPLPPDLFAVLSALADEEERSPDYQAGVMLRKWLRAGGVEDVPQHEHRWVSNVVLSEIPTDPPIAVWKLKRLAYIDHAMLLATRSKEVFCAVAGCDAIPDE